MRGLCLGVLLLVAVSGVSVAGEPAECRNVRFGVVGFSDVAAVTQFPKDLGGNSRRWVAKRYPTLMYWGTAEHGGHFAAFEQPEIFVREVRNGLRPVRVKA